jgi:hypothetical protein
VKGEIRVPSLQRKLPAQDTTGSFYFHTVVQGGRQVFHQTSFLLLLEIFDIEMPVDRLYLLILLFHKSQERLHHMKGNQFLIYIINLY